MVLVAHQCVVGSRGNGGGRLVSLLDAFAAPPNGIYAVFPHAKHLPLRVRLWIDFLKHTYGDAAYWRGNAAATPRP